MVLISSGAPVLEKLDQKPFEIARVRTWLFTATIVIFGLALLVLANVTAWKDVTLLGGSLPNLFGNIGFAAITLAAFQAVYDHQQREVFFREVRREIAGSESFHLAGSSQVFQDSKRIDFSDIIKESKSIDLGVLYSDKFLKDYQGCLKGRSNLKITIYHCDPECGWLVAALAGLVRKTPEYITQRLKDLETAASELKSTGTDVELKRHQSLAHYSFERFDGKRTFLNLSTFAGRRADVATFDLPFPGFLSQFVADDIDALNK